MPRRHKLLRKAAVLVSGNDDVSFSKQAQQLSLSGREHLVRVGALLCFIQRAANVSVALYCSNVTLQTVARELFKSSEAQFINERHRPDIVVLPEKTTWQMTGIESSNPIDPTLTRMQHVLIIELKKGGFELTRKEINQADGYVQDIAASGGMSGSPFICAWVVGQKIAAGVERDKQLGNPAYGRVRAATFGSLVDTANARLLKLRSVLADRYGGSSTDELLNRVFAQPTQDGLGI